MLVQPIDVITVTGSLSKQARQGYTNSDVKLEEHSGNLILLSEDELIHPTFVTTVPLSEFVGKYVVDNNIRNMSVKYIIFDSLEDALNPFEIARVKKNEPNRIIGSKAIGFKVGDSLSYVRTQFNKLINIDQYPKPICVYLEIYMMK
jgi:hypothetical protein